MEESEKFFAKIIFGWTWRRFLALCFTISAIAILVFATFSLLPSESHKTTSWKEILLLSLLLGPLVTTAIFLYFRFIKGPILLSRLQSKGKTDTIEFCNELMNKNGTQQHHALDSQGRAAFKVSWSGVNVALLKSQFPAPK